MRAWRITIIGILALSLLAAFGCGTPRTTNQGGGTILSAMSKLDNGDIGSMTADELQILGDTAASFGGVTIPPITDDEAQLIVDFLADNNIQTLDELTLQWQSGELDIPQELIDLVNSLYSAA